MLQTYAAQPEYVPLQQLYTPEQLMMLQAQGVDLSELGFFSSIGNAFKKAKDWTVGAVKKAVPVAKKVVAGASDALHIAGKVGQAAAPMVGELAPSYSDSFSKGMGYLDKASHYTDIANQKVNGQLVELNGQLYFVPENDMGLVY